jgi:YidC/Oxa1 family membrane protein insertase
VKEMRNSTRIQLVVLTLFLVVMLSGCSSDVYTSPVGIEGGWGWLQWTVEQIADFTYWVSIETGGYYFVGLIIVTLIVRTAGWPIYAKSNALTMNMQQAQPELDRLKEKYQGKTDEASQKKMQAETLAIYKKYGINPFGCLLPFLQMPIFIAMYQVVRRIPLSEGMIDGVVTEGIKDYSDLDFSFLWVPNLAEADPWYILPILVGLLMFFYQRYSMKKPDYLQNKKFKSDKAKQNEKTMKMMSYFMVVMLVSIAVTNAGIALYWVVGNAYQFLQTYFNRRRNLKKFNEQKERF